MGLIRTRIFNLIIVLIFLIQLFSFLIFPNNNLIKADDDSITEISIEIYYVYPSDKSTDISILPNLTIDYNITFGGGLIWDFEWLWEQSPGVWKRFAYDNDINAPYFSTHINQNFTNLSTTYNWRVQVRNNVDVIVNTTNYTFTTTDFKMINCSTDKNEYIIGETVNLTAFFDADYGDEAILLVADNKIDLKSCDFTNKNNCIAYSEEIVVSNGPQQISVEFPASTSNTWFAKICNISNYQSDMIENTNRWNKKISNGNRQDIAYAGAIDDENNLYISGTTHHLWQCWWLKKYDENGIEVPGWDKEYGAAYEGSDEPLSIAIDDNGSIYTAGYFNNSYELNGSKFDWWIKKHLGDDSENLTHWNKTIDARNDNDRAYSITTDSNNSVYVTGYATHLINDESGFDWSIKKFEQNGNLEWEKSYDGNESLESPIACGLGIAVDSNDNVYSVGYGYKLDSISSQKDWWIKKFSKDGIEDTTHWNISYDIEGSFDEANSIALDNNNNVYVVGHVTNCTGYDRYNWHIKKFDSNGIEDTNNWNKTYDFGNNDSATTVAVDNHNNVYVGGYIENPYNQDSYYDMCIMKFNETGHRLWKRIFCGNNTSNNNLDCLNDIVIDNDENIYLIGYGNFLFNHTSSTDWWIKKFEHATGSYTVNSDLYVSNNSDDYIQNGSLNAPYKKIQHAIENATNGSNIYIWEGTYNEEISVDKSLNIMGNNTDSVILDGENDKECGITLQNTNINISNLTISKFKTSGVFFQTYGHSNIINITSMNNSNGIYLIDTENNTISNCQIFNNNYRGVWLDNAQNSTIHNNTITNNTDGFKIISSSNNEIFSNNISGNNESYGIIIETGSNDNQIYNNYIFNINNSIDNNSNTYNLTTIINQRNIINGPNKGGNYWSNYLGHDTNHDGIGDTQIPYNNNGRILVGGDSYPLIVSPKVTSYQPNTAKASRSTTIYIYFNKEMNTTTTISNLSIRPNNVQYTSTWLASNQTLQINPTNSFSSATNHNITINWNATDSQGNVMLNNFSFNFTTTTSTPTPPYTPGVGTTTPNNTNETTNQNDNENQDDTNNSETTYELPQITIINPKPNTVTYENNPTIKATYQAVNSTIDTSKTILKINNEIKTSQASITDDSISYQSKLGKGNHSIFLSITDTNQQTTTRTWSFSIASKYYEIINIQNTTNETQVEYAPANQTHRVVERIKIKTQTNETKINLTYVEIGNKKPDKIPAEKDFDEITEYIVYEYLEIEIESNNTKISEDLYNITILIKINNSWIEESEIDNETIKMLRYHDQKWNELEILEIKQDEKQTYFEVEIPGLSTFAVVGSKVVESDDVLKNQFEIPLVLIITFIVTAIIILVIILFKAGFLYIQKED